MFEKRRFTNHYIDESGAAAVNSRQCILMSLTPILLLACGKK